MRRYHFDLVDANTVTTAAILDNDNQARSVAMQLTEVVREQRPGLVGRGYEILVRSESGDEVLRATIDPPGGRNGPLAARICLLSREL